jgi:hypothetical protein
LHHAGRRAANRAVKLVLCDRGVGPGERSQKSVIFPADTETFCVAPAIRTV